MASNEDIIRYSDVELAEFGTLIQHKLTLAEEQLESLQSQIIEISENSSDKHGGDWVDDSSVNNDIEMLNNMAIRQRKYIQDLSNAMQRIKNKTYGICLITGELIDKRRLLAVPTTTKSLTAKTDMRRKDEERMTHRITDNPYVKEKKLDKEQKTKIITKVVRKGPAVPPPPKPPVDEDEDEDDFLEDDDLDIDDLDFDNIADDDDGDDD
jgi:RNA polymerase-binding transcription factor DksA